MLGAFPPSSFTPGWAALPFAGGSVFVLTDTLSTVSDSVARTATHPRTVSDTGTTLSDSLAKFNALPVSVSDTAVTGSDSISLSLRRGRSLSDTFVTFSDALAQQRSFNRSTSDTVTTVSDSLTRVNLTNRPVSDTAATLTDSLRSSRSRSLADTAATVTDSISLPRRPQLADTLTTMSDTVAPSWLLHRQLADTVVSLDDVLDLVGNAVRFLTDTLANVTDVVGVLRQRAVSDSLTTFTDSLASNRIRALVDTITTISSVLSHTIPRNITDTLVTMSDVMLSNDFYRQRTPIWGTAGTIFGTNTFATLEIGEFRPGDYVGYDHTVWYEWLCPASGKYRFQVQAYYPYSGTPSSDMWMAVYEFDPGAVLPALDQLVIWNDDPSWYDGVTGGDPGRGSAVNFHATAGQRYIIQVGAFAAVGVNKRWSPFDLVWLPITTAPVADDFPGRTITNGEVVSGNAEWATAEPGDPWYWIRDLDWPLGPGGTWLADQYVISNRTMLYKFTPDITGTATLTFYEIDTPGQETGELEFWLFDGDGVSAVTDLTFARKIVTDWQVYAGDWTFPVVAGRDYYLWIVGDEGPTEPDARHRFRVRWGTLTPPPNDDPENPVDLDDGIWHENQTTENATWEEMGNPDFFWDPPSDPPPRTVWYRATYDPLEQDTDLTVFAFRDMSKRISIVYFRPLRVDEQSGGLVDTLVTMSDSLTLLPLRSYELADTLTSMSDTVARVKRAFRTSTDTAATIVDLGIGGAGGKSPKIIDVIATVNDTVARSKIAARAVSDFAGNQFNGTMGFSTLTRGAVFRGRGMADTAATITDSVSLLNLRHYNLTDTLVSMSDTVARNPANRARTIETTVVTMSDQLTRIPPVTVTDTAVTMTDSLTLMPLLRGRPVTDRIVYFEMWDTIATNRPGLPDTLVWWWPSADYFTAKVRRVTRSVTDTATTMSDGIS